MFPHTIEIPDLMRDFGEFLEQAPATPAAAFDALPYLNALAQIADKRAGFRSRGDIWADATTPDDRLMLTVLGGLAELGRGLIRARMGEGRERAKARGMKMGRKPELTPHQRREALSRCGNGEPMREIVRSYNLTQITIWRLPA